LAELLLGLFFRATQISPVCPSDHRPVAPPDQKSGTPSTAGKPDGTVTGGTVTGGTVKGGTVTGNCALPRPRPENRLALR